MMGLVRSSRNRLDWTFLAAVVAIFGMVVTSGCNLAEQRRLQRAKIAKDKRNAEIANAVIAKCRTIVGGSGVSLTGMTVKQLLARCDEIRSSAPRTAGVKKPPATQRIRELLRGADTLRARIFGKPAFTRLRIVLPQRNSNGTRKVRIDQLLTYKNNKKQIQDARKRYEAVLRMDPGKPQAILGLGNLALIDAMTLLTSRAQVVWRLKTSKFRRNRKLVRLRKLFERRIASALRASHNKFNEVLSFSPQEPTAHLGIGIALAMQGKWQKAKKKFERMVKEQIFPPRNRSIVYVWKGFVQEHVGDSQGALKSYSKAGELREPYAWAIWADARVQDYYMYRASKASSDEVSDD